MSALKEFQISIQAWWVKSIILATQEAEVGKIMVQGQSGQKVHETSPISTNDWVWWYTPVIPAMWGSTNRIPVEAKLGITQDTISKITNVDWRCASSSGVPASQE
jgi:hypothetical protein